MKSQNPSTKQDFQGRCGESGVALVLSLLILSLMSLIGLGMVLSVSSDMMVNGYYRNYRGSFYAADSGLNVARQDLLSQIEGSIPSTFATPPIPSGAEATALSNTISTYGGSYHSINAGQAASSWAESFTIPNSSSCPTTFSLASGPTVTSTDPGGNPTSYQYIYNYTVCALGRAQGSEQETVSENGSMILNISGQGASSHVSFAAFGAFIDKYPPCQGALVPGTMTGPMFTNGAWQFMTGGKYIFTDPVGQQNANADYWFGGKCIQSPTSSYSYNGQMINPNFQAGLQLNQPSVPLPPNDFSQKWAAVDGLGQGESDADPSSKDLNLYLKDINGDAYPKGGATSGVFLNYDRSTNTVHGGGFYVEGNAQVSLAPSGASAQVYTITQGGTSTTITVDPVANTTTVTSGTSTLNLSGVPENLNPGQQSAATMLYVNGNVASLSGPGEGQAAIQDGTALTITAAGDVTITGDVNYKSEPVTTTQNQIPGTPADTPIPANDHNQVLGIFTATGSIKLQSSYADQNLEVDGSLAAISQGGTGGFFVNGHINTFTNVGGQIQNNIYGASMNTENTYFDRRFTSRAGFAPPWFPSTTISSTGASATSYTASVQRVQWINSTALQ